MSSPECMHNFFCGHQAVTEIKPPIPAWKGQVPVRNSPDVNVPFQHKRRGGLQHRFQKLQQCAHGNQGMGQREGRTVESLSFAPQMASVPRLVWHSQTRSVWGRTWSTEESSVGWEMNLPLWICQNHNLKPCYKLISSSSLQHLQAVWTTILFKIPPTFFFFWATATKQNKQSDAERLPPLHTRKEEQQITAASGSHCLVSSRAFLLAAFFPKEGANSNGRAPYKSGKSTPSVSWALWNTSAYFQPRGSAAIDKIRCVSRKEDAVEASECSSRCFPSCSHVAGKTKRQEKQESCTAVFGYVFRYLYWNTIIFASIVASPSARSYRE